MRDYRILEVWTIACELAVMSYHQTGGFPPEERLGLTSQIRRAAVSIAANIAEGSGRDSDAEMLRFVRVSLGSRNELETLLAIAAELGFTNPSDADPPEAKTRDLGARPRNFASRLQQDLGQTRKN